MMSPRWRWIMAMGFSALVLVGGLVRLLGGGTDFRVVAWMLVIIGGLALAVNAVMRDRMM